MNCSNGPSIDESFLNLRHGAGADHGIRACQEHRIGQRPPRHFLTLLYNFDRATRVEYTALFRGRSHQHDDKLLED
jgi:hypothetical protein